MIISKQDMNFVEYSEKMMDYLEYLGYPEYVLTFEPLDVAKSLHGASVVFYEHGFSYRMAAIANFGLTMTMQVMREGVVKH